MAALRRLPVLRSHDGKVPLQRIDDRVRQTVYSTLATFAIVNNEQAGRAVRPLRIRAA